MKDEYSLSKCTRHPMYCAQRHSSLDRYLYAQCASLKHAAYYSWHRHCTEKDSMWIGCGRCYSCINDTLTLPMSLLAVLHKLGLMRDELRR